MATLSGLTIQDTYQSLVKISDNDSLSGKTGSNVVELSDGLGNKIPISISQNYVKFRDNIDFTNTSRVSFSGLTDVDFRNSSVDFNGASVSFDDATRVSFTGATEVDFKDAVVKFEPTTTTTGILRNVAVYKDTGRQPALDGQISFSGGTGININEDISTNIITITTTGEGTNVLKIGTGITTTIGKAVYWDGTEWATNPTASNAYDKLIGISVGTNTLTNGVYIGGLITDSAQTGYTAGDLYLSRSGGAFETNKNNIYSPDYIRGVGHSLGSLGIVLNPDIYYEQSIIPEPTPTPTPTSSITPTPSITPTLTPTPTPSSTPPSFDADALAYLEDVSAAGGTTGTTINDAVNTLYTSLKSNGLYNDLFFFPFVGGTAASHSLFGKRSAGTTYDITWFGGMTHGISGSTGDGINGYGETALQRPTFSNLGDVSQGIYVVGDGSASQAYELQSSTTDNNVLITRFSTNLAYVRFNGGFKTASNTDGTGLYISTLTGSTNGNVKLFKNTSTTLINTTSNDNDYVANNSWIFLGGAGGYSPRTTNFVFYTRYLTDAEASTLSTIINTFQTSLGRNIY